MTQKAIISDSKPGEMTTITFFSGAPSKETVITSYQLHPANLHEAMKEFCAKGISGTEVEFSTSTPQEA
ncbi:hypothetical protein [Hymenobacter metallicola]|uniref:Uncharacterized protein n=1 Tax=Hymenobacter metallicola TaxID=2563114 RepID=A0A4Z0QIB3_9BACT|nr:hypothetical protein [Hymenobacter metallicola]TGE29807.1 hypothetical protein E5K02_10210 [Hymenobacter metallicola]